MTEKINKCCVCEKDTEGGWLAKDGEYYCNVCYDNDFFPRYYGFTRSSFLRGESGYTMKDVTDMIIEKIHEKNHELFRKPRRKKPKLRLIKGGKDH